MDEGGAGASLLGTLGASCGVCETGAGTETETETSLSLSPWRELLLS